MTCLQKILKMQNNLNTNDNLREEGHYNDLYDLLTIKNCLRLEKQFSAPIKSSKKIKATDEEKLRARYVVRELFFYHTKGERYKKKSETIRKWVDADRLRDEKLENTNYTKEIYCNHCDSPLEFDSKHLHDLDIEKLRVLLFSITFDIVLMLVFSF